MPEFDLKELLASLGETAANVSDGSFDEGDIVVLNDLKDFLEGLIEGRFADDIQKPMVKRIMKGFALLTELYLSDVIADLMGDDE